MKTHLCYNSFLLNLGNAKKVHLILLAQKGKAADKGAPTEPNFLSQVGVPTDFSSL
ncbi:hypothetical protein Mucpa_1490 [Mucilaginibacter paludis DSM 18603]|uniref:Uncharacterized protein n=1 Tax=Mucilaginibacter paludis DSM 18603 TaxID=714943 RepID=H1Y1U5_9SPHI|nr:hypothetical protein Mucpa_1490 [Mucilaginibacter paludis DSM 18603]